MVLLRPIAKSPLLEHIGYVADRYPTRSASSQLRRKTLALYLMEPPMIRHLLTIITIVWCTGGFAGYSLIRIASLADAADDAIAHEQRSAEMRLVESDKSTTHSKQG